jgi:catechol 2,3-dioxygenase-like lactoylglutathione lyase family enzyme
MRNVQPLMIDGIDHVGISVSSLDRALAFYRDILGMRVVAEGALDERHDAITNLTGVRCKGVMLRIGSLRLELFEFANPRPRPGDRNRPVCDHGITHIAIRVNDIEREYERLAAAGVAFHCPPQRFPSGNKATYGRDPDGNVFELLEPPSGT